MVAFECNIPTTDIDPINLPSQRASLRLLTINFLVLCWFQGGYRTTMSKKYNHSDFVCGEGFKSPGVSCLFE